MKRDWSATLCCREIETRDDRASRSNTAPGENVAEGPPSSSPSLLPSLPSVILASADRTMFLVRALVNAVEEFGLAGQRWVDYAQCHAGLSRILPRRGKK